MNARIEVTTQAVASPPASSSTPSGQAFVLGATQRGPVDKAVRVTSPAGFRAVFGDAAGGPATADLLDVAFRHGLGAAWVGRLAGPAAMPASKVLGSALTVTATSPGAWGNAVTAGWTDATKTLVVDGVGYPAPDVATLQAALRLAGAPVVVSGTLPAANVTAAALTGGTDDSGNASIPGGLSLFDGGLGTGAVTVAGHSASTTAEDLAAHCEATNRLGLLAGWSGDSTADIATDLALLDSDALNLLFPWLLADGTAHSPAGLALGARARAHATGNPARSPLHIDFATSDWFDTVEVHVTDDEFKQLDAAGLSLVRSTHNGVRLSGWRTVSAPQGVKTLQGAQYRDLIGWIGYEAGQVADRWSHSTVDGKGVALGALQGSLVGLLERIKPALYSTDSDPGYRVDCSAQLNPPEELANGVVRADISIKCAPTADWLRIGVTAGDAAARL